MAEQTIRFDDGAAYEQAMGVWSRFAGQIFLDWLAPPPGLRWIDVGCGNGAFTELLVERCAPSEIQGIDPSEGQLAYARAGPAARLAEFRQGDAMALPFPADRFDAAVMALVLVFVPQPAKCIAEMARVVSPGGIVAAYMWDMPGGGFPTHPIADELRAMGLTPPRPPQMDASRMPAMRDLWTGAGLEAVETREITVHRTFTNFEEFWTIKKAAPTLRPAIAALPAADLETLKNRVRARLPAAPMAASPTAPAPMRSGAAGRSSRTSHCPSREEPLTAFFIVRSTVADPAKRAAFDKWYQDDFWPDVLKSFGVKKAWRFWSLSDPALHLATYQFDDEAALDRAMKEEVPRLIDMFVRDWPDVPRVRETFVLAQEFGA